MLTKIILLAGWAAAQQFSSGAIYIPQGSISQGCYDAINGSLISCASQLAYSAFNNNPTLDVGRLNNLCNASCYTDIVAARGKVAAACANTDQLIKDEIAYPATYLADLYMYTFNVTCRKDRTTGQYCDALNNTDLCSDCVLGVGAMLLNSPFGYDSDAASRFASVTSSCGSTNYQWTTPTSYAFNSTATLSGAPPDATSPTCASTYTVSSGDTCNSVAASQGVSTFAIINLNGLDIDCTYLPPTLCLPEKCAVYSWTATDDCDSVAWSANITLAQLQAWNPVLNQACGNLNRVIGSQVCIGPPGGGLVIGTPTYSVPAVSTLPPVPAPITTTPTTTTAPTATPTPVQNCTKQYVIQAGDSCALLEKQFDLTFDQLYYWNPSIGSNCEFLETGVSYCIAGPAAPTPTTTNAPPAPTQSGLTKNCNKYYTIKDGDGCDKIEQQFNVTFSQLSAWNPAIGMNCENLWVDFAICVGISG